MKKIAFLSAILGCLSLHPVFADDQPRGSLMEVHSCELYAGGCVVSSEATLGGRYMLRAWNFTGGTHNVVSGASCTADSKFTSGPPKTAPYSFTQKFDTKGTVDYFCQPHCASANMVGRIIVQ